MNKLHSLFTKVSNSSLKTLKKTNRSIVSYQKLHVSNYCSDGTVICWIWKVNWCSNRLGYIFIWKVNRTPLPVNLSKIKIALLNTAISHVVCRISIPCIDADARTYLFFASFYTFLYLHNHSWLSQSNFFLFLSIFKNNRALCSSRLKCIRSIIDVIFGK